MNINDTILLATRNKGKIKELSRLLLPFGVQVAGLADFPQLEEVEETGATFLENAMLKAAYASQATGLVAVADDSGIMVDALEGQPGVFSARFSAEPGVEPTDERNNAKLAALLEGLPKEKRTARFCSAVAAVAPSGARITAEGFWEGYITSAPKGENGFGYDPLFFDPELGLTAAEMSPHEKNERSHRAQAIQKLLAQWPDFWTSILK